MLFVLFSGGFGYSVYKCDQAYKSGDPIADKGLLEVNITPDYFLDVLKLKDTWLAFSIISGIFTLIILLIFIALRKRISLAIELINQGMWIWTFTKSIFLPAAYLLKGISCNIYMSIYQQKLCIYLPNF